MRNYKKEITKRGLMITWIAHQMGLSQPYLSMKIHGHKPMTEKEQKKLDKILGL